MNFGLNHVSEQHQFIKASLEPFIVQDVSESPLNFNCFFFNVLLCSILSGVFINFCLHLRKCSLKFKLGIDVTLAEL